MTTIAFLLVALFVFGILLFAPFSRKTLWRATVTPLASIIGSGFLVSAPLLAREFGGYAAVAMAFLVGFAALIGWAIRYNIKAVEPQLIDDGDKKLASIEKLSHVVLAFAYFVSVAYYLSLLGNFILQAANVENAQIASAIAMALLAIIGVLGLSGGVEKITSIERYATALNLAVISGFLAALAAYGFGLITAGESVALPAGNFKVTSLPMLLGLLIVVQGFETTRFTGNQYAADTRRHAMSLAQLLSAAIYILFFLLLTPLLTDLSEGSGVAAIISVSAAIAAVLPISLTVAAAASQFSASVADSIGEAGLVSDLTGGRVDQKHAYPLIALVGIGILATTNVNGVIALASRAFALFYALQCLVAWESARRRAGENIRAAVFFILSVACAAAFIFGTPAE